MTSSLLVGGVVTQIPVASAAPDAGSCTISSDKITPTAVDLAGSTDGTVNAWDAFKVEVSLKNLDGLPEGCTAVVKLPSYLHDSLQSVTLYLNADGQATDTPQADSVVKMVTDPDTDSLIFTTTAYPSTHTNVAATGWVQAQLNSSIKRGQTVPLEFTVNGDSKLAGTITGAACDEDCPAVPTDWVDKWGEQMADGTGYVVIQTAVVESAGTTVSIVDQLTNGNQSFGDWASARGYDCVNDWGDPGVRSGDICDTNSSWTETVTGSNGSYSVKTSHPNEFIRLSLGMNFTGSGPWTDKATVKIPGMELSQTATVNKFSAGGGASGDDVPQPTTPVPTTTEPTTTEPTTTEPTTTEPSTTEPTTTEPTTPTTEPTTTEPTTTEPSTTEPTTPTTEPTTPEPSTPVPSTTEPTTTEPTTPASSTTSAPSVPTSGPKVETDRVDGSDRAGLWAGISAAAATLLGGGLVMRRRRQES